MANFVALTLLIFALILQVVCANEVYNGGLKAVCKKLPDRKFCVQLLNPYASQFEDNDRHKMGHAAISATLSRTQAARAFMIRQITEPEITTAQRGVLKDCLDKLGGSVDSLRQAAAEFNEMGKSKGKARADHRKNAIDRISSSSRAQNECYDLLNAAELDGDVIREVRQEAEGAAKASSVAQYFVE